MVSAYGATMEVGDAASVSRPGPGDLVLQGFTRGFGGAFVGYARGELGFHTDLTYDLLDETVARRWNWYSDGSTQQLPEAGDDLRDLLTLNVGLRVFVASGYSDLVEPYAAVRYVLDHILPVGAPGRLIRKVYRGGHMIYLNDASRIALTTDVAGFFQER